MDTPEVFNTIDAVAPASAVLALPAEVRDAEFDVCWSGQDDAGGSDVALYTIHVSDNGGAYRPWLTSDASVCGLFTGAHAGHTYRFYSVALDHVGNAEPPPIDGNGVIVPDAITTVSYGDFDQDGDVDLADYGIFHGCLTGPLVLGGADHDQDGDVDIDDFAAWPACWSGPGIPPTMECATRDLDVDGDVDLVDFGILQARFTAPGGRLLPLCVDVDFDADEDVDLNDFAEFESAFTGS